jgi:hypothetical protein
LKLCRFKKSEKWKLLYRGSSDGFGSDVFHSKCDGIAKTLIVVKATNQCVFGGYTEGFN